MIQINNIAISKQSHVITFDVFSQKLKPEGNIIGLVICCLSGDNSSTRRQPLRVLWYVVTMMILLLLMLIILLLFDDGSDYDDYDEDV